MINYHEQLVAALNTVLPSYYEMTLHSGIKMPCISYMELTNVDTVTGDTLGYSRIQYQVKVWGTDIAVIQGYALEVDKVLRPLGFKRVGGGELSDNKKKITQKILTYEANALESYE